MGYVGIEVGDNKMIFPTNIHELNRICPRCGGFDVSATTKKYKINGDIIQLVYGVTYNSYVCKDCGLIFDEAV